MKQSETTQIIEVMEPQDNGFQMEFEGEGTFYCPRLLNPFFFMYGAHNTVYELDNINFYDESGNIVYSVGRGWFNAKHGSNNRFQTMQFLKDGEPVEPVKKLKSPTKNGDHDVYFIASKEEGWTTGSKKATLYVPIAYLDNLGYQVQQKTTVNHVGTIRTTRNLYVKTQDIHIHISSKTEKHFPTAKQVFIDALGKANTAEELEKVINEFKYEF